MRRILDTKDLPELLSGLCASTRDQLPLRELLGSTQKEFDSVVREIPGLSFQ